MLQTALKVGESLNATVANMRFVKPLDSELIRSLAATHRLLVTLEENATIGGAGSGVSQLIMAECLPCSVINLGLPDAFIEHGEVPTLMEQVGLDAASIERRIQACTHSLS
jgi:1-deoxy-D-xylulose-5-phosphate synthase